MSKNVNIRLKKADIYGKVQMGTEYAGSKDPADAELYKNIVLQDENFEMLDEWWEDGLYSIIVTLSHYLTSTSGSADAAAVDEFGRNIEQESYDIDFVLVMPDNWKEIGNNIDKLIQTYMTNYLLAKWMIEVKQTDMAGIYTADAAQNIKDIKRSLTARKRPNML